MLNFVDRLQHGNAVFAAAAEIVDLAATRIRRKFLDGADDIVAVDVVADLLALVAKNRIGTAGDGNLYEIGKKTVKLDAGMRRAGEASASENADFHAEIPAVFLGHQVRRGFGGAEERMQRAVDAAIFGDAVVVLWAGIFPAGFQFLEGEFVGRVTINLVGAQKNEDRFGAMKARGFEKIDRAEGVDFKIENGDIPRLVVRRLRRTVNDQIEAAERGRGLPVRPGRGCRDYGA